MGISSDKFFRHRVVAARIVRFHGRRADDDFGAQGFQQIDFFLGLLVGDGEDHFVAAHRGDEREAHSRIAGSAFDDGAAGPQQTFALGFVNHGGADAVFHRAARIQVIGFDVNLGLAILGHAIEAHQWRVANGFEDVVALHDADGLANRGSCDGFRRGATKFCAALPNCIMCATGFHSARGWVLPARHAKR